jgi:hypothetical protein
MTTGFISSSISWKSILETFLIYNDILKFFCTLSEILETN